MKIALITLLVIAAGVMAFGVTGSDAERGTVVTADGAEPGATPKKPMAVMRQIALTDGEFDGTESPKTDAEWKKELSAAAYYVLREEGTERPYSGALTNNHKEGTYYCDACGLALFSSKAKFESGTGWPSFFEPIFKKNVTEKVDRTLGEERTEVECARCHSHLGHVFDDGPEPTGLRYCMNSISLRFKASK